MMPLYLVLSGLPGAGKGTQGELLSIRLGIPHISTGNLFRESVRSETELGLRFRSFIERGEFVPDSVVASVVQDRLQEPDALNGAILDGFPRTVAQTDLLTRMLQDSGRQLSCVIYLKVSRVEATRRLRGRLVCSYCQKRVYHKALDFGYFRSNNRPPLA